MAHKLTVVKDPSAVDPSRRAILLMAACTVCVACDPPDPGNDASTDDASTDDGSQGDASQPEDGSTVDGSTSSCPPDGLTELGPVSNYPMGELTLDARNNVVIGRDAQGLWAVSTVCPHFGAPVRPEGTTELWCSLRGPEHSSRFTPDGAHIAGPGTAGLANFALAVCDGVLYVDPFTRVPAGTRTPAT